MSPLSKNPNHNKSKHTEVKTNNFKILVNTASLTKVLKRIYSVKNGTKSYYDRLTSDEVKPQCCSKWEDTLNKTINWKITFAKVQKIAEINMKWFQIRLVQRIYQCHLIEHGGRCKQPCSFCEQERDSLEHNYVLEM